MRYDLPPGQNRSSTGLVDVLDRVLDKGLVIAGDIRVSLAEVELLTIRIRLLVCSLDKAQEIGLDWWKYDQYLSPGKSQAALENQQLRAEIKLLERRLAEVGAGPPSAARRPAQIAAKNRKPRIRKPL
jgi:hypothetical protein